MILALLAHGKPYLEKHPVILIIKAEIMTAFYVYILKMRDNRLYVGHTNSLSRRHTEHEQGKGSRTTDIFGAGDIIYAEEQPDRVLAARREKQIKGWTQAKKISLATGNMGKLHSLAKRRSK